SYLYRIYKLIICHPPRHTLVPYTTLFRSRDTAETKGPARGSPGAAPGQPRAGPGASAHPQLREAGEVPQRLRIRERFHVLHRPSDRKSTRLNSSHVKISYAVFCLKKKRSL